MALKNRINQLTRKLDAQQPEKPWLILVQEDFDDPHVFTANGKTYTTEDFAGLEQSYNLMVIRYTDGWASDDTILLHW